MSNGFLLDTNIISKFAPDKITPSEEVRAWFHEKGENGSLYLSAMTIAEIEKGARSLYRRGGIERADRLNRWLAAITENFYEQILPMDIVVARIVGALADAATSAGHNPGVSDLIIAATAKAYDLTVVTENLKHFLPLAIKVDLPECFK
ncbi:ribonuclease VapC [Agrobacterium rubi TR3 = NBRC 13261]|uniref:Ribonuclease VapC n=1 Tax=Agrobacterium rubi TR3 = NBRC 13261 TaxID=1368415 RepID=A0A081D0F9_9HYPH|nr:type II toxin-antitoxin system VapC family toxin [Agrobacterium rubi]MBP1878293.1 putative nucleic acid-binding protein [Agrobacterium rubi]MCL6653607.1 plasmid stabilization protein [Agrobacterium rubi]GAK72405.1 ribonuclease VapC [Agrobacterium rubi TR3 = NBRC 13261]